MEYDYQAMLGRLSEIRRKEKITQEELAKLIDINPKNVSAYETGTKKPSLKTFINICIELGVDMNYLIYGIPSDNSDLKIIKRSDKQL
ncbi:MAG: helix-turn-helix transcriptional regulator [Oscillospiraceae bacterium]|nr:helix-turn-helix transcriptional regulator [Oscillospiraceae bacterium]